MLNVIIYRLYHVLSAREVGRGLGASSLGWAPGPGLGGSSHDWGLPLDGETHQGRFNSNFIF